MFLALDDKGNIIDCFKSNSSICDSINIEIDSFNFMTDDGEATLTINMSTFFTSSEFLVM